MKETPRYVEGKTRDPRNPRMPGRDDAAATKDDPKSGTRRSAK